MKRKISLLLAVVMAMTMALGMSVTAFAATIPEGYYIPTYDNGNTLHWAKKDELYTVANTPSEEDQYTVWIVSVYIEEYSISYYAILMTDGDGNYYEFGSAMDKDVIKWGLSTAGYGPGLTRSEAESNVKSAGQSRCGKDCYLFGWFGESGPNPPTPGPTPNDPTLAHVHNFQWQTISAPTNYTDGLEAEVCTICGARRNEQTVSAFGYALYSYGLNKLNGAKSGDTVILEFGEWNSFPKQFMEKVKEKVDAGVTVVFKLNYQHAPYEITIPAYSTVYTNLEWCGPACMYQLYVLKIPVEN